MITKEIGGIGEFADIGAAWANINPYDGVPFGDSYKLLIVGDFTETTMQYNL
jgi:hypothetical protein